MTLSEIGNFVKEFYMKTELEITELQFSKDKFDKLISNNTKPILYYINKNVTILKLKDGNEQSS